MELKQLATGRMTRKGYVLFGRIHLCLNKPSQEGSNATFSLVEYVYVWIGSPQVTYWQIVLVRDLCLSYVAHPALFGPYSLGVRPLKWTCKKMINTQPRRSEMIEALTYQGCRLIILDHNIYMDENMYNTRANGSGVIRPKMSNVPRSAGLLLRCAWVLVVSNINEVVGSVVQVFADHKGSFPRWGELVHICLILDKPEHQVTLLKGSSFNLSTMIATQILLVYHRTSLRKVTLFIQQIKSILTCFSFSVST